MKVPSRTLAWSAIAVAAIGLSGVAQLVLSHRNHGGPIAVAAGAERNAAAPGNAKDPVQAAGFGAMVRAVAPPPPPPPRAEKGDVQLDGIYLQITSLAIGGRLVFTNTTYYFMPDGHVFSGMPPGGTVHTPPTAEDLSALMKFAPKNLGTYKVTGKEMTIRYGGGDSKPVSHGFALQKSGDPSVLVLDGAYAVRYGRFKDNQTFEGKYSAGSSIVTGGNHAAGGGPKIHAASSTTLDLHADGTFGQATITSLDVNAKNNGGGSSSSDGHSADHGKYNCSGNTLTLTFDNGKTRSFTAYPMDEKNPASPGRICVGGNIYTRE